MLGEEGDRRRLQQRVCKWMDTGTVGSGRTQLGKGQFGGHTTTVAQEAQKGPKPEQPVIRGHTSPLRGTSLTDRSEWSREQGDISISEEYLSIPVFRESLGICGNLSGFLPPP